MLGYCTAGGVHRRASRGTRTWSAPGRRVDDCPGSAALSPPGPTPTGASATATGVAPTRVVGPGPGQALGAPTRAICDAVASDPLRGGRDRAAAHLSTLLAGGDTAPAGPTAGGHTFEEAQHCGGGGTGDSRSWKRRRGSARTLAVRATVRGCFFTTGARVRVARRAASRAITATLADAAQAASFTPPPARVVTLAAPTGWLTLAMELT